jgi:hypothetical protein
VSPRSTRMRLTVAASARSVGVGADTIRNIALRE